MRFALLIVCMLGVAVVFIGDSMKVSRLSTVAAASAATIK